MKRIMMVAFLVLAVGVAGAFASTHNSVKVSKYVISLEFKNNPPRVGSNQAMVTVKDTAGTTLTDAKVFIDYDMPRMHQNKKAAIDEGVCTTDTYCDNGIYTTTLNFTQPGDWVVHVKTVRSGRAYTAKFNVNVVK